MTKSDFSLSGNINGAVTANVVSLSPYTPCLIVLFHVSPR